MTEDGGRRGRDDARRALRVVGTAPPSAGTGSTEGTTQRPADDARTPPGLAGRRRGAGARAGAGRIPVYPRVPTGPWRPGPGARPTRSDDTTGDVATVPGPAPRLTALAPDQEGPVEGPPVETFEAVADEDAAEMARLRARAERFTPEDEVTAAARERAAEHGIVAVGPGAGAALTFLASSTRARAVVEIGTGAGVGTVSLLRGMPREGLLTSIDCEPAHQRLARVACAEAGFAPGRVRMITGRALDVLPRLSDAAYDLVLVDAATVEYPRYLEEALRLLRPGGVVVLDNVLWTGRIADAARRDAVALALRETVRAVRTDERLAPLLLPVSDGLLCASLLA